MVGLKQTQPESRFQLGPFLSVPTQQAPLALVLLGLPAVLFFPVSPFPFFLLLTGTLSAWVFIRYAQRVPGTTLRGDYSDAFRFSTFFPAALQPAIDRAVQPLAGLGKLLERPMPGVQEVHPLLTRNASKKLATSSSISGASGAVLQRIDTRGQSALAAHMNAHMNAHGNAHMNAHGNAHGNAHMSAKGDTSGPGPASVKSPKGKSRESGITAAADVEANGTDKMDGNGSVANVEGV